MSKYTVLDEKYFSSSEVLNAINSLDFMFAKHHSEIQQFLIIIFGAKLKQVNIFVWQELHLMLRKLWRERECKQFLSGAINFAELI